MKRVNIFIYITITVIVLVVAFYLYIGIKFGEGVSNFGKDVYKAKKEWEKHGEIPLDSIANGVTKTIDSVNHKNHNTIHSDNDTIKSH